ncbi:MAG: ATP-binding protein [Ktedonobacteraceae bacterium]
MLPLSDEQRSGAQQWSDEARPAETTSLHTDPQPAPLTAPARATGVCPCCRGAGYTRRDAPYGHPDFGKIQKCACKLAEERAKRKEKLRQLSAMEYLAGKTFATFNWLVPGVQTAYRLAYSYAHHPQEWMLLTGPYGCGKTHLAASIGNVLLNEGWSVLFVTVPDLLDHLRATFAPTSPVTYDEQFTLLCRTEALILDDLGAEQTTAWAEEKLFQLINYRYIRSTLTVITTNHIRLAGIHERIRSRLHDAGLVQEAAFDETVRDYRSQLAPH